MGKKRKSDATRLDEVDRGLYSAFSGAANFLSQLYSQAMHQQRFSYHSGERHALEKLYNWILREQENGVRVMPNDVVAYIQNELDYAAEEPPASSRLLPFQQPPQSHAATQLTNSAIQFSSNGNCPAIVGQGQRSGESDQTKNLVFSNALSSPVRRSLQHYHLSQGSDSPNNAIQNGENNCNQTRDVNPNPNPPSSNDTSMDIHADSPDHDSPY